MRKFSVVLLRASGYCIRFTYRSVKSKENFWMWVISSYLSPNKGNRVVFFLMRLFISGGWIWIWQSKECRHNSIEQQRCRASCSKCRSSLASQVVRRRRWSFRRDDRTAAGASREVSAIREVHYRWQRQSHKIQVRNSYLWNKWIENELHRNDVLLPYRPPYASSPKSNKITHCFVQTKAPNQVEWATLANKGIFCFLPQHLADQLMSEGPLNPRDCVHPDFKKYLAIMQKTWKKSIGQRWNKFILFLQNEWKQITVLHATAKN